MWMQPGWEFVEIAAEELGMSMKILWHGDGLDEVGIEAKSGKTIIRFDPSCFRPAEVETLLGVPLQGQGKARLGAEDQL
jgi:GDPmannose 4,6-dehydratase